MDELVGQTLGQYTIVEEIGAGGMATVYKAHQPALDRDVAVKVLSPFLARQADFTERFTREAQAIGKLNHPNILPVYDFGQDKGYSYLVIRYIPNATTLSDLMKRPLEPARIVDIVSQVAAALDHAHQAGIIHRDVKPDNIMVDGNWFLLTDFGLAKILESPTRLTGTGVGMGTPAYMSPEQGMGEPVDQRTDIYSLGIIVYEMLTGKIPHQGETPIATVMKRITDPLPSPRSLKPSISPAVEKVLLKALELEPSRRFQHAGELAEALKAAFSTPEKPVSPPPPPPPQPPRPPVDNPGRRQSAEVGGLALLSAFSACSVMLFLIMLTTLIENPAEFYNAFLGAGPLVASASSLLLLWFRNKTKAPSALLALALVLWFLGLNTVGFGLFAAFQPSSTHSGLENFGYSVALCDMPGLLMALAGFVLYLKEWRSGGEATVKTATQFAQAQTPEKTVGESPRLDKLRRANEYAVHIKRVIRQNKNSPLARTMGTLSTNLNEWENRVKQLVNRLISYDTNRIIQRDLQETPAAVARIAAQLENETDPQIKAQMQETLAEYQNQLKHLQSLVKLMRRTELELEESLASVASIYSQIQLFEAKEIDSERAERLSEGIDEQSNRLRDLLLAVDEVYGAPEAAGRD